MKSADNLLDKHRNNETNTKAALQLRLGTAQIGQNPRKNPTTRPPRPQSQ